MYRHMQRRASILGSFFLTVIVFCTPVFLQAITVDELQAQLQALLSQISALQKQIENIDRANDEGGAPSALSVCPSLSRTLSLGARGSDVTALQRFLIGKALLPADSATGYFGPRTEFAVQQWQAARGIVHSGTSASTGFGAIGPKTRAALIACGESLPTALPIRVETHVNEQITLPVQRSCPAVCVPTYERAGGLCQYNACGSGCGPDGVTSFSTLAQCTLSGGVPLLDVQVISPDFTEFRTEFAVAPTSGPAPLGVLFTVKTNGYGSSALYLDFGDGEKTPVASTAEVAHAYSNPGTYTARLSAENRCTDTVCRAWTTAELARATVTVRASEHIVSPPPAPSLAEKCEAQYKAALKSGSPTALCQLSVTEMSCGELSTYRVQARNSCETGALKAAGWNAVPETPPLPAASISVSAKPDKVKKGGTITITWSSSNAPAGSRVALWLQKDGSGRVEMKYDLPTKGTQSFRMPDATSNISAPACFTPKGNWSCHGVFGVDDGTYTILARLYKPESDKYKMPPSWIAARTSNQFTVAGTEKVPSGGTTQPVRLNSTDGIPDEYATNLANALTALESGLQMLIKALSR